MNLRDRNPNKLYLMLALILSLVACGEQEQEKHEAPVQSTYQTKLFITFDSGPNKGRHQYVIDEEQNGKIELKYNKENGVTFMLLRGLKSLDGSLKLKELSRFTLGELVTGTNSASNWRAEQNPSKIQCGVIKLSDADNSQSYQNGFAHYKHCSDTMIESTSGWENSDDSVTKRRVTKGRFEDRVLFEISMDTGPFQRFEADMRIEFDLLETRARF